MAKAKKADAAAAEVAAEKTVAGLVLVDVPGYQLKAGEYRELDSALAIELQEEGAFDPQAPRP